MRLVFITGVAGFVGRSLADQLLRADVSVVGWDNFSTGQQQFIATARQNPNFALIRGGNLVLPAR